MRNFIYLFSYFILICFNIYFQEPPKKKFMKVTQQEEKLFNVLVDRIKETIERKIEIKLNYYYQKLDARDLVVAGGIGDVENNYQLLADLGMHALLSIYCASIKFYKRKR